MAKIYKLTDSQKKALAVITIFALLFGFYFLRGYLTLIIFAALLAFSFNPFYQRRLKKSGKPSIAASQTLVVAILAIIIPLFFILALAVNQINHTVKSISDNNGRINVTEITQRAIDKSNEVLAKTPSSFRITPQWIETNEAAVAKGVGTFLKNNAASYLGGIFGFFTTAVIFIFVFLSLLKNQKTLLQIARDLNPLGVKISDLYINKISLMTKAMIRGQFIIAIVQGLVDTALIYVGGLHTAFFFFFVILTILSFIPLGGGIVAIPIGIAMILSGNILGGIIVIAGHILIVTNVDNILRPRLVPKEAKLDSALTILSVFAGISLFGFLGVIVGPVIMIVIVTTIEVYQRVHKPISVPSK